MLRTLRAGAFFATLLGVVACAGGEGGGMPQWSAVSGGPAKADRLVIRSADAWQAWWRDRGREGPHVLDPAREMAVVVALGERRTGGYRVSILSVVEQRGRLAVRYKVTTPPPGAVVMQMITHPWAAAIVPRSELPVVFQQLTPAEAANADRP